MIIRRWVREKGSLTAKRDKSLVEWFSEFNETKQITNEKIAPVALAINKCNKRTTIVT